jgi:glycine/D-amino acid oxidase-like deaminating enzyme
MLINTDIIIIGGGIAGLWTANKLKNQGLKVLLLEADALGAGQTIRSQGIIHGGLKYALSGSLNSATTALSDMPLHWQKCLDGIGDIDLRDVEVLATGQHMWSINKITGGITTLFASSALTSHVETVDKENWPQAIRDSAIQGKLYKLQELVLNVPTLIAALSKHISEYCIKIDSNAACKPVMDESGSINYLDVLIDKQTVQIKAQQYIFTAGSGNEELLTLLEQQPLMQRRPLQMVMVKDSKLSTLYGHCVGLSSTPLVTVTTHIAKDGVPVWYLGGKLAEEGANIDPAQQIKIAKQEIAKLFPEVDLRAAKWVSFYVDRAEAKQAGGGKPNSTTVFAQNNFIIAWPTKLALAPILADEVSQILEKENIKPKIALNMADMHRFSAPTIAQPIWDQLL